LDAFQLVGISVCNEIPSDRGVFLERIQGKHSRNTDNPSVEGDEKDNKSVQFSALHCSLYLGADSRSWWPVTKTATAQGAVVTMRTRAKPGQGAKMQSITINLLKSQSYIGGKKKYFIR
jgi:hypothetical protein